MRAIITLLADIHHDWAVYGRQVRDEYYTRLSAEAKIKREEGKFPFEGNWHSLEKIPELQKKLKKKDRCILLEILSLYFFCILIIAVMFFILARILSPR